METACLRIKFTPLLQNIYKEDSKHCLEIVPEITCIQNLDKILWRKEENSIEYTIPMTYKIILRKKHVLRDDDEPLDKTYHSCVDLLLQSSDTNFKLGSGDISRIVSDTFVLSKVTTDVEKCSILLKETNADYKNDNSIEIITTQVQTEGNTSLHSNQSVNKSNERSNFKLLENTMTQTSLEVTQSESNVLQVPNADAFNYIDTCTDKITNTEISRGVEDKVSSLEGVQETWSSTNSRTETKRNLSLTPICSINTDDTQIKTVQRIASNTIMYLRYETQSEYHGAEIGGNEFKRDDLYCSIYKRNDSKVCKALMQYDSVTSHKLLPEVRVANFIDIMEKEIMPLKLMLSDIISKCSNLGFSWKKTQQTPILYKNVVPREKSNSRCLKTKKQINSNRVVYSIVFDG